MLQCNIMQKADGVSDLGHCLTLTKNDMRRLLSLSEARLCILGGALSARTEREGNMLTCPAWAEHGLVALTCQRWMYGEKLTGSASCHCPEGLLLTHYTA